MHNPERKNNSSMMWMMLPCLLIIVFAIFAGGGGLRSWPFLLVTGAMVVGHLWMMFRGYGSGGEDDASRKEHVDTPESKKTDLAPPQEKKGHSSHSCCH